MLFCVKVMTAKIQDWHFKTLSANIERLSDKATSNSLSLWERAEVRGIECRFIYLALYTCSLLT
jgi:hypothetical protein